MEILREAIAYLESCPAKKWIIDYQTSSNDDTKHCALGWLAHSGIDYKNAGLYGLLSIIKVTHGNLKKSEHGWQGGVYIYNSGYGFTRHNDNVADVNNGVTAEYKQKTPKERTLTYFRDALAAHERLAAEQALTQEQNEAVEAVKQILVVSRETYIPEMGKKINAPVSV